MDNELAGNDNVEQKIVNKVMNKCALASFICSLVGLIIAGIPCGIGAVITGIIGMVQISKSQDQKGKWMAIFGIIVGALDFILVVIALPNLLNELV